ncbi:900_t:CDS:2 [Cetraspora pellucida]|uniref:900_t:CDS:1 n=1 Tax=Cetraspora pellucida TaxID=1433469 RepID=A0A9N8W7W1_9GLOM|nr:900_t:CDS:2 [Cetraspora pellucida]
MSTEQRPSDGYKFCQQDLSKEWAISKTKRWIDDQMQQIILIKSININLDISQKNNLETNKNVMIDIDDSKIVEKVTESIGKAAYSIEKYETLEIVLAPLIQELSEIKSGYLDNEGHDWNICLYFLANWKFLAICLEHKAANAKDFCLWCSIKKNQNGIKTYDWTISKRIENLNINYFKIPSHKSKPLFSMISLTHWVVDELHVMLQITDQLWLLLVSEVGIKNNSKNSFNELYKDMHKQCIDGVEFKKKALNWIDLFLTSSSGNLNYLQTFVQELY